MTLRRRIVAGVASLALAAPGCAGHPVNGTSSSSDTTSTTQCYATTWDTTALPPGFSTPEAAVADFSQHTVGLPAAGYTQRRIRPTQIELINGAVRVIAETQNGVWYVLSYTSCY